VSRELLDKIFGCIEEEMLHKKNTVEEALQKALTNTTIRRPGTPWDKKQSNDGDEDK
jgi:hypothetical protein